MDTPEPLPDSSRRFLESRVGVDTTSVQIHRDERAQRAAFGLNAEAVTAGDDVLLGAGHATDSPETLGLLAHELTHVARRRNPRFVPPIIRPAGAESPRRGRTAGERAGPPLPSGEEELARHVEAEVTREARASLRSPVQPAYGPEPPATPAGQVALPDAQAGPGAASPPPGTTPLSPGAAPLSPGGAGHADRKPHDWGGLPAPWEPLPDWLVSPKRSEPARSEPAAPSRPPPEREPGGPRRPPPASRRSLPEVERAELDRPRDVGSEEGSLQAEPPEPGDGAVEPDLDALARQVYTLLKRRLDVERRRWG